MSDTCDCCGKTDTEVHVHSSSIGAMSFASCKECLSHNTEPEFCFHYLYDFVSTDGKGLREITEQIYKEGKYWTWDEWLKWRQTEPNKTTLDQKRDADIEAMNSDTKEGD
jgi:hypothetical protein